MEFDGKRKKKTAACDACKKIKKACDFNGEEPCSVCAHKSIPCVFSAQKKRGPRKADSPPREASTATKTIFPKGQGTQLARAALNVKVPQDNAVMNLIQDFMSMYGPLFRTVTTENLIASSAPVQYFSLYSVMAIACRSADKAPMREQLISKTRQIAAVVFDDASAECVLGFILFSHLFSGQDSSSASHYGNIAHAQLTRLESSGFDIRELQAQCRLTRALVDPNALPQYIDTQKQPSSPDGNVETKLLQVVLSLQNDLMKSFPSFHSLFYTEDLRQHLLQIPTPTCVTPKFTTAGVSICSRALGMIPADGPLALTVSLRTALHGLKIIVRVCCGDHAGASEVAKTFLSEMKVLINCFLLPFAVPYLAFIGRFFIDNKNTGWALEMIEILGRVTCLRVAASAVEALSELVTFPKDSDIVEPASESLSFVPETRVSSSSSRPGSDQILSHPFPEPDARTEISSSSKRQRTEDEPQTNAEETPTQKISSDGESVPRQTNLSNVADKSSDSSRGDGESITPPSLPDSFSSSFPQYQPYDLTPRTDYALLYGYHNFGDLATLSSSSTSSSSPFSSLSQTPRTPFPLKPLQSSLLLPPFPPAQSGGFNSMFPPLSDAPFSFPSSSQTQFSGLPPMNFNQVLPAVSWDLPRISNSSGFDSGGSSYSLLPLPSLPPPPDSNHGK